MECEICGAEIKTGIMKKIRGTYIMDGRKKHPVCNNCQKEGETALKEKLGKNV